MLGTMHPSSGFSSDSSLPRHHSPATPPYTPAKPSHRLERADSPASSIHPAETVSPPKKLSKSTASDNLTVEELRDGDPGFLSDTSIVYPQGLEEVHSRSDDDRSTSPLDSDSDIERDESGIVEPFEKLSCNGKEQEEARMENERRARRRIRRTGSRPFKRSHSKTVKGVVGVSDPSEALDDQDTAAGVRRLRRRTKGPDDTAFAFEEGKPPEGDNAATQDAEITFERRDGVDDDGSPGQKIACPL